MVLFEKLFVYLFLFLHKGCIIAQEADIPEEDQIEWNPRNEIVQESNNAFTVSIFRNDDFSNRCAGCLIRENVALTVAHCVMPFRDMVLVVLGASDISQYEKRQERYLVFESDKLIHPHFNEKTLLHDIAVLRLMNREFGYWIRTVELPNFGWIDPIAYLNGYKQKYGVMENRLSTFQMRLLEVADCRKYGYQLSNEYHVCGYAFQSKYDSSCMRVAGAPLFYDNRNGTRHGVPLIGLNLVRYRETSCDKSYYVFIKVIRYDHWIREQMKWIESQG